MLDNCEPLLPCDFLFLWFKIFLSGWQIKIGLIKPSFWHEMLFSVQVPSPVGKRSDCRAHGGPVLQGEVQPAAQVPTFTLSAGWPGAEAHLPAPGGERKQVDIPQHNSKYDDGCSVCGLLGNSHMCLSSSCMMTKESSCMTFAPDTLLLGKRELKCLFFSFLAGVQHCTWSTLHQEADRQSDVHHDQSHSSLCSRQTRGDQQAGELDPRGSSITSHLFTHALFEYWRWYWGTSVEW